MTTLATVIYVVLLSLVAVRQSVSILIFVCLFCIFAFSIHRRDRKLSSIDFFFGLAVCLLPMFGSGSLLLLAGCYVLYRQDNLYSLRRAAAIPFVAFLAFCALVKTATQFSASYYQSIFYEGGGGGFLGGVRFLIEFLRDAPPPYLLEWEATLRWGVLFLLLDLFAKRLECRRIVLHGVLCGLLLATITVAFQHLYGYTIAYPNFNPFWSALGRLPGTFTDPNAYGVAVALLLPFLLFFPPTCGPGPRQKIFGYFVFVLVGIVALYSGSRSYLIGLFFYCLFALWHRSHKAFRSFCFLGLLALVILQFIAVDTITSISPPALIRTIESFHYTTALSAAKSRLIFWEVALKMWFNNPILGVGFMSFRNELPSYLFAMDVDLNGWSDNANSFYLGILAETGIIGALLFGLSIQQLLASQLPTKGRAPVYCLLLLLCFGPHLDFDEITVIAAIICSPFVTSLAPRTSLPWMRPIQIAIAGLVLLQTFVRDSGFYGWERSTDNSWYRWTTNRASAWLFCPEDRFASMQLRAPHPELPETQVSIESYGIVYQPLIGNSRSEIKLPCIPGDRFRYQLSIPVVWCPSLHGFGDDNRRLGVQVFSESGPHYSIRWK